MYSLYDCILFKPQDLYEAFCSFDILYLTIFFKIFAHLKFPSNIQNIDK